jgi:hypothetical protein
MDENTTPMGEGGDPTDKRVELDLCFTPEQKKQLEKIAKATGRETWEVAHKILELNMNDRN